MRMRLAAAAAFLGATSALVAPAVATAAPSSISSSWYDTGETYNKKAACERSGQWYVDSHTNVIRYRCDWTSTRVFHLYVLLR
ncbi:hypothetical protein ACIO3O_28610 [Streptomyces sp. NPDC087440]|uniref:hypothetical protein n=1 Tax=Streptomyces sp. NPDC087440 TaxID=3365790 RepID=UPI00380B4BDE